MTASERYYRLKAAGLCVDCGRPVSTLQDTITNRLIHCTRCEVCRGRQTQEGRKRAHEAVIERKNQQVRYRDQRIAKMLELARKVEDLARRKEISNG